MENEKPAAAKKTGSSAPKKAKKRNKTLRRVMTAILTVLLVILAVLVFVFRDNLSEEALRERLSDEPVITDETEAFTYESGTDQVFAVCGDGLAVASGSAAQLLNGDGETVWKQIVSYSAPAVFGAEEQALFCDIGARTVTLVSAAGEASQMETDGDVLTASMNDSGAFVLVTEASGYKGLVRVYNAQRALQYEWWSGTGYVLRAAISPDSRLLAVLCADGEGGKLHVFSLSSENELGCAEFPQELPFDLRFMDNDTICCLSETAVHFVSDTGEETGTYRLGDYYLMDYDLSGDGYAALFVSAYRAGTGGLVMTVSDKGELLGYAELGSNVVSMCARGKQLLVLTAGGVSLYGQDMTRQNSVEALMTAKKAVLQENGTILLLSAYAAEQFRF